MQPILGFMCTLDVLGYSYEQYATVPFLVLAKALEKYHEDPKEINKKIMILVRQTCFKIVREQKDNILGDLMLFIE